MRETGIRFLARESVQVILHGYALAQGFVHLKRQRSAQQRLSHQQRDQVWDQSMSKFGSRDNCSRGGMAQQLRLVADEMGFCFLLWLRCTMASEIWRTQVAAVRRLQIQLPGQLTEQIQSRSRSPVQIQDLVWDWGRR